MLLGLAVICGMCIYGCGVPPSAEDASVDQGVGEQLTEQDLIPAVVWSGVEDSIYEDGVLYRLAQDTANHIYVLTKQDTNLLTDNDAIVPNGVEQVDLDQDGHQDIIVNLFSNTPGDELHFLFDPGARRFVPLRNADYYANTAPLEGANLCWSYNRAGCADYSWESWLYGIHGDSAFSLAHMEADICPGEPRPIIRVYLSRKNQDSILMDSIPADTSMEFFGKKWDMMTTYWRKNHKRFLSEGRGMKNGRTIPNP